MKTSRALFLACAGLSLATLNWTFCVGAAENGATADPAGTWKWTYETQSGQTVESSAKLKREGEKLTGTFTGRGGTETDIRDGKVKDDEISFTIVRERNGQKITARYSGKVSGDTIKGKADVERGGQTRTQDWEARRVGGSATGTWKWSFEIPGGQTLEPSAKLAQDGDKLSGALTIGDSERPISEGAIKGAEVSFKVLSKRDDRTVTSNYHGTLSGDTIKGKWDSDWTGEVVTRDWEAKRFKE
jgi:hypothetical protein